jgi:hypothetical protein
MPKERIRDAEKKNVVPSIYESAGKYKEYQAVTPRKKFLAEWIKRVRKS